MARQSLDSIEALEEILGSLRITKEYTSDGNRTTELAILEISGEMSMVPAEYYEIAQTVMPKSMVLDPG